MYTLNFSVLRAKQALLHLLKHCLLIFVDTFTLYYSYLTTYIHIRLIVSNYNGGSRVKIRIFLPAVYNNNLVYSVG